MAGWLFIVDGLYEEFGVRLAVGSLQFDPDAAAVAGFGLDTDFAVHAVHRLADQRVEG
jgi:hypothetical protein